jgi:hypothetical protein
VAVASVSHPQQQAHLSNSRENSALAPVLCSVVPVTRAGSQACVEHPLQVRQQSLACTAATTHTQPGNPAPHGPCPDNSADYCVSLGRGRGWGRGLGGGGEARGVRPIKNESCG